MLGRAPRPTLFPYTTLFRSSPAGYGAANSLLTAVILASILLRAGGWRPRSEEHTSELQSHVNLVCRLLLEKKNNIVRHKLYTFSNIAGLAVGLDCVIFIILF